MATYELIEHIEVGSGGASSIVLDEIASDYADLYLVLSGRSTDSETWSYVNLSFNGSTSNRSDRQLYGYGSGTGSTSSTNGNFALVNAANTTSNTFGSMSLYIPNYAGSSAKSVSIDSVTEQNATSAYQRINAFLWNDTSAITSITLTPSAGNFAEFSSATLYGIREHNTASAPKATGGIITYDAVNNKWVHTFTASGTFTPTESLTAEVLLVAGGGGGGGRNIGGGGGAGGYIYSSSESFGVSAYTATVGGGGAKGGNSFTLGTSGVASSLTGSGISLTSPTGGGGGGMSTNGNGLSGGSGGGAGNVASAVGGSGTAGQGNDGGDYSGSPNAGGGGGGAGSAGSNPSNPTGGAGGSGINTYSALTAGDGNGYLMGGGAGGSDTTIGGSILSRSLGGGGTNGSTDQDGLPATGSGGGGFSYDLGASGSGNGGSGIVIVRYAA